MAFSGAYTALITPFKNSEVDHKALSELVERQIDGKIDGLVPCGTTGESATLTEQERLAVIKTVVDQSRGRVPIIAGTGSNDTAKSIAFTKAVSEIKGVDAALVVAPYYNKPGQRGLVLHFEAIANASPLPLVLYNVPGRTVISLSAPTVATLAKHPNIVAIKEASADMVLGTDILATVPGDFDVLSGDDFTTLPLVCLGGKGCISVVSNLAPTLMHELVQAGLNSDLKTARELHQKVVPFAKILFSDSNPVPTKAGAALLGWCSDEARLPLYSPDEALKERVAQGLKELGLLS